MKKIFARLCSVLVLSVFVSGIYAQEASESFTENDLTLSEAESESENGESEAYDASTDKENLGFLIIQNFGQPNDFVFAGLETLFSNLTVSTVCNQLGWYSSSFCSPSDILSNFTSPWIWDKDSFFKNQVLHPYMGATYFTYARANDLTFAQSVLYAAAGSLTWETLFADSTPSINDLITTSFAGSITGEMLHRLSFEASDLLPFMSWFISPGEAATAFLKDDRAFRPSGYLYSADVFGGVSVKQLDFSKLNTNFLEAFDNASFGGGADIVYGDPYGHNTWELYDQFSIKTAYFTNIVDYNYFDAFLDGIFYSISLFDDSFLLTTAGITMDYDIINSTDLLLTQESVGGTWKMLCPLGSGGLTFDFEAGYSFLSQLSDAYTVNTAGTKIYSYRHGPCAKAGLSLYNPVIGKLCVNVFGTYLMNWPGQSDVITDTLKGNSYLLHGKASIERTIYEGLAWGIGYTHYFQQTLYKNMDSQLLQNFFFSFYLKYTL